MRDENTQRIGGWIQTFSGRQVYPMDMRPEDVDIVDIAHALSMQCRYAGHCRAFYSVAEHSWLLSHAVAPEYALWALLHDASEAYLVDVPRPLKPFLVGYSEVEAAVQRAVCERFGLDPVMPAEVKEADQRILVDEREQNMGPSPADWGIGNEPLGVCLSLYGPEEAEDVFLSRFRAFAPHEVTRQPVRGYIADHGQR